MLIFDYSGKTVLVTGGTQGIGLGIASAFCDSGARVMVTGTRRTASDYADDLSRFTYIQAKLDIAKARKILFDAAGPIDILINNAGQAHQNEYVMDGFSHVMEVNLNAAAEISFLFHECLKERRGNIVNVGSCASFLASPKQPAYAASKAGLLGLTRSVADKWAYDGIRVNLVAPGFITTRMTAGVSEDQRRSQDTLRAIPAGRFGSPADIAAAVLFLASPQASYITGQSIIIDGGLMLR